MYVYVCRAAQDKNGSLAQMCSLIGTHAGPISTRIREEEEELIRSHSENRSRVHKKISISSKKKIKFYLSF